MDTIYPSLHRLQLKSGISDCRYRGKCYNTSWKHRDTYRHPDFCPNNGYCRDMSDKHLLDNQHLPLCPYALQCHRKMIPDHSRQYRHCNRSCSKGSFCVKFHNTAHTEARSHPFLTPCPGTPYNCPKHDEYILKAPDVSNEIKAHCYWFAHACYWGRQCPDTSEKHIQTNIHVARHFCPYGPQCSYLTNEDHLNSYAHVGHIDLRLPCTNGTFCLHQHNVEHVLFYRHEGAHHFRVAPYFGFHEDVDYVQNQCDMLARVNQYAFSEGYQHTTFPRDIAKFVRVLQPMHRCKRNVFESILLHGHLMSSYYMDFLNKANPVAQQIWTQMQKEVEVHRNPNLEQTVCEFILSLVQKEFQNAEKELTDNLDSVVDKRIQFCENKLKDSRLGKEQVDAIRDHSVAVAKASLGLYQDRPGIQHGADKDFGTDKHVFAILGPNFGHRYGDIMILFKREVMQHPDANFAIQAATTFDSGRAYKWRPWLYDPGERELRVKQFALNVLHCSVKNYEHAAAAELTGITAKELEKNFQDICLEEVIEQWMKTDPHRRFEAHLPALIPLDYIDHIYMPESIFKSLSPWAQTRANEVLGSSLTVTEHNVPSDDCIEVKIDPLRKVYQEYVLNEIVCRFKRLARSEHNSEVDETQEGFVITLPASTLETHVLIPIRISQSYTQFKDNNLEITSHPSTFIYWQALGGDMMVILANERIYTSEKQCQLATLTCYIADAILNDKPDEYSYITGAPFYSHYMTQDPHNTYEVSSNTFNRGCNSQGYIGYCLHIEPSTGYTSLSHAGSNTIYNQEKLTYQFAKEELDLSCLDWVHLSAGNKMVSITNFIITHESIPQLHPSFDKNFKFRENMAVS